MTKLNWSYVGDEQHAYVGDYRIRAIHEDGPENPFTAWEDHWPMVAYYDKHTKFYDRSPGLAIAHVLDRFTPASLVFNQKAIAAAIGPDNLTELRYYIDSAGIWPDDDEMWPTPKWVTDSDVLYSWFHESMDGMSRADLWEAWSGLYAILGIPCLNTSSHGYCQGDYTELFIVATPEAQKEIGCDPDKIEESLEAQAKLYGYWAWGDVYGYIVEKFEPDEDGEDEHNEVTGNWEEIPDGSCWGYYGDDFAESGLEEAALESLPDDAVTSRDKELAHD